jgi:hypothetical protein
MTILHDIIPLLATEAWERYKQILHAFNLWATKSVKNLFTPNKKSILKKEVQIIDQEVKNIYEPRLHELRGKDYKLKNNLKNPEVFTTLMGDFKAKCLDLIFDGMESSVKEKGALWSPNIKQEYQLIANLFIDIVQLKLLSKQDL